MPHSDQGPAILRLFQTRIAEPNHRVVLDVLPHRLSLPTSLSI